MPEISRFLGMIIVMYYKDHLHVRYNQYKASIRIDDLLLMSGKLPPRAMGLVVEWASRYQAA